MISRFIEAYQTTCHHSHSLNLPFMLIGTSKDKDIPLKDIFLKTVHVEVPNTEERAAFLREFLVTENVSSEISAKNLAAQTAGFVFDDYRSIVRHARARSMIAIRKER